MFESSGALRVIANDYRAQEFCRVQKIHPMVLLKKLPFEALVTPIP